MLVAAALPAVAVRLSPRTRRSSRAACRADAAPPVSGEHTALLAAACEAATRAGRLCVDVRRRFDDAGEAAGGSLRKADATPVTVADFGVQALVSLHLARAFPDLPLVAEEDAAALRSPDAAPLLAQVLAAVARNAADDAPAPTADAVLAAIDRGVAGAIDVHAGTAARADTQRWVLDPIDGTKGFLRGGDAQYAVGLALLDASAAPPVLGVLALPNWTLPPASAASRGVVLAACRGGGAWVRPLHDAAAPWQRASCDATAQLHEATVCVSDHERWEATPMAAAAAPARPAALLPLCCGSLVKYAAVALGQASLFVQHPVPGVPRLKSWDHAAGVAAVLGAGGAVVDFSGRPLALGAGRDFVPAGLGVLVSNAAVSAAALALLPPPGAAPDLVFLDRDGCINVDRGTWIMRVQDLQLLPGAAAAVSSLNAAGITTVIITNQSCVGRGMLSWAELGSINASLAEQLAAASGAHTDALFVAADDPDAGAVSARRKPGPGMLLEAMALYGVPPALCAMVGDTTSDMRAAAAAGVARRFLVGTGHGARFAAAAADAGIALPVTVAADGGVLAQLLPPETLPLQLHADLASAVRAMLQ